MDTCGWCANAQFCDGTNVLYRCIPKDIFVEENDKACTSFCDEENGLIDNNNFSC